MANTAEELRGLLLSAEELKNLEDWSDVVIEDYLSLFENLITLATAIDSESEDLSNVNQQISSLNGRVGKLKAMIGRVEIDNAQIVTNTNNITINIDEIKNINQIISVFSGTINKNRARTNNILNKIEDLIQLQASKNEYAKNRANINKLNKKINDIEQLIYMRA